MCYIESLILAGLHISGIINDSTLAILIIIHIFVSTNENYLIKKGMIKI